jgi:hypothetical protein
MNLRLENLAKWVSLIALIVLIGAPLFNIKIGENKMGGIILPTNGAIPLNSPGLQYQGSASPANNGGLVIKSGSGGGHSVDGSGNIVGPGIVLNPDPADQWNTNQNQYSGPTQAQIYAQQQAAAKAAADRRARDTFSSGANAYRDSVNSRATSEGLGYKNNILDFVNSTNTQQQNLDSKAVNAEMAKTQGYKGIAQMVGQGIRSGGVMLAGKNAGSSSGAEAIANAYSQLGQEQASGVNNQYGQAQNQIGLEQSQLEASKALQLGKFNDHKTMVANSIIDDARGKIAALNEAAANASITDRLDIAAEIENVRNTANSQLQQYDALINNARGASSSDARRQEAQKLATSGVGPTNEFKYSTETPTQFQNSGPWASEMPLWTYNKPRQY